MSPHGRPKRSCRSAQHGGVTMSTVLRAADGMSNKAPTGLWDTPVITDHGLAPVLPGDTLPEIFWNAVARRGDSVFMRQKQYGLWRSWTWAQTGAAVREIAHGLMALGFAPRDTASVLAHTVVEWVLVDLAILS